MTALQFEGNSVWYGDILGLVDQSEVHVDVQVYGTSMLVFSGGKAFNGVVEELKKLTMRVTNVLPVFDDGGSTTEINWFDDGEDDSVYNKKHVDKMLAL